MTQTPTVGRRIALDPAKVAERAARESILQTYFEWRKHADEVEAETGLRPEMFRDLEGRAYPAFG